MDLKICIFGDSITWGGFDTQRGGWAEYVKTAFFLHEERLITTYNLGIPGKDSNNLIERYENELKSRDGNIAIIAIGINDASYIGDESNNLVSIDIFLQNLQKIQKVSEKLQLEKLVFVGLTRVNESMVCPYPGSSTGKSYKNHIIEKYDNTIRDFCKENSFPYIDIQDTVSPQYLPDGLHPDADGNKKMAEKILPELKKILNL